MPEAVVIEASVPGSNVPTESGGNLDLHSQFLRSVLVELRVQNRILLEGLGVTSIDLDVYRAEEVLAIGL